MSDRVVVLGAGYAGSVAIRTLERQRPDARLTWISDVDYHLVLHEVHRAIRDPDVSEKITVPIGDVKPASTEFVRGAVVGVDTDERRVEIEGGEDVDYDYLLVALGSDTAFYGIPGLAERALTLNGLDDALAINRAIVEAGEAASRRDPARVIVGGAGLSGIQTTGEVAELRDREGLPVEIALVEALEEVMPGSDPTVQRRVRAMLEERNVDVLTDDPVTEATDEAVHFDERPPMPYDVLVWTGGITGRDALEGATIEDDHERLLADATFRTSDDRVFAVGDAAVVDVDGAVAPPTAQAAWDAASVAARNVVRAIEGRPLDRWSYRDKGTLVSVGEEALAHDVLYVPVGTFGGPAAAFLKKLVAARWIATITSWRRGLAAWDVL